MTSFERRIISVGVSAITSNKTPSKFNHASLICYKGRILSIGLNNQYKTHPLMGRLRPNWAFIHSELSALVSFKRATSIDLSDCLMYNIRLLKNGGLGLSMPCKFCTKLIVAANFKSVYFTNNLGLFEKFTFK